MIGNKKKFGFILISVGSVFWAKIGLDLSDYALALVNVTGIAITVINWLKWREEEKYWCEMVKTEKKASGKFFWEN